MLADRGGMASVLEPGDCLQDPVSAACLDDGVGRLVGARLGGSSRSDYYKLTGFNYSLHVGRSPMVTGPNMLGRDLVGECHEKK